MAEGDHPARVATPLCATWRELTAALWDVGCVWPTVSSSTAAYCAPLRPPTSARSERRLCAESRCLCSGRDACPGSKSRWRPRSSCRCRWPAWPGGGAGSGFAAVDSPTGGRAVDLRLQHVPQRCPRGPAAPLKRKPGNRNELYTEAGSAARDTSTTSARFCLYRYAIASGCGGTCGCPRSWLSAWSRGAAPSWTGIRAALWLGCLRQVDAGSAVHIHPGLLLAAQRAGSRSKTQ